MWTSHTSLIEGRDGNNIPEWDNCIFAEKNIANIFFFSLGKTMYFSLVLFLEGIKLFWLQRSEENSAWGRHPMQHGKI